MLSEFRPRWHNPVGCSILVDRQHCFTFVHCVYAGSSVESDTAADSTDKSQPFEIKTVDITEQQSRIHSGEKPYKCHVCAKEFSCARELNSHIRINTGDEPYMCSMSNKSFSHSGELQIHTHVHSNTRPYLCPYCGKTFKANHHLKCHVRIHTGAKPYSCSHCPERFTRLFQLKRHLLNLHVEGTWFVYNIFE